MPLSATWGKIATLVIHRPGLILSISLLALVPFAILGARTTSNYSQLTDLSPDQPSIIGSKMIRRYFPAGELGPSTILIEHPKIDFRSERRPSGCRGAEPEVCRGLKNVAEVRSISRPLGRLARELPGADYSDRVRRPFVDPATSRPRRPTRPTSTTSPGST